MILVTDKLRENQLRWYGRILKRPIEAPVRNVEAIQVEGYRKGGDRFKKCLIETLWDTDLGLSFGSW